jgi:CHAD domain-containing protein
VRTVALARLHEATVGYQHLLGGDDDGLHDLRVALRRLRTWVRAFHSFLDDTLKKKTRRRLTALARATSGARDAEVAAAWVASQTDIPPRAVAGVRDVARRLNEARHDAKVILMARLDRDFAGLAAALTKQLALAAPAPAPVTSDGTEPVSMSVAAADVIERQTERVAIALRAVKSMADTNAHRARIAAKRLRYVLEPLAERGRAQAQTRTQTQTSLGRLVALQDHLGAARDAHALADRMVRDIGARASCDAGVLELVRRAQATERASFTKFRKERIRWIAEHSSRRPVSRQAARS